MKNLFAKDTVCLDVTSDTLSAIVGVKKAPSVFYIKSLKERKYSGFAEGNFFDPKEVFELSCATIMEAANESNTKSNRLFVSVPGEFVTVITKEVKISLDRCRKINNQDIDFLIEKGIDFDFQKYSVINKSVIYFTVDNDQNLYFDVRGVKAKEVVGCVSYTLCEKDYCDIFEKIGECAGFKDVRFIASNWAEGLSLFDRDKRKNMFVLLDVGYLSSTISLIRGEGVIDMRSFSMGGGHISGDICEYLNVPFELAEEAKDLVDLNVSYAESAVLVADAENTIYGLDASLIAKQRIQLLAEIVEKVLALLDLNEDPKVKIYLTGSGISNIRGASQYLSTLIGKNIEIVAPKLAGFDKPEQSSLISLLDIADTLKNITFNDILNFFNFGGKK